MFGIQN